MGGVARTTSPGSPGGARADLGPQRAGRGLAALRSRLRHLGGRVSHSALQVPWAAQPRSALRPPGLPPWSPSRGVATPGPGDEREEPP